MRPRPAPIIPVPIRDAAVLGACLAAAAYLRRLGSEPWAHVDLNGPLLWLARTPAEDVISALLRLAALGACWWVAGTFLAALLVRAVGWRPAIRVVDRVAPRLVRRLAQRLTGGALLATSILGPAVPAVAVGAGTPPATAEVFVPPGVGTDRAPGPTPQPHPSLDTSAPPPGLSGEERRVRVRTGDHLWGIARAEVARRRGVDPLSVDPAEVAGYWQRVVQANAEHLRSGDPDLLFPGEEVLLPGG